MLACYPHHCQGIEAVAVYGTQGFAGFEESRIVRHEAALSGQGREKQLAFSSKEDVTESTCRQGAFALSRWQVAPVMAAGVGNYPKEDTIGRKIEIVRLY